MQVTLQTNRYSTPNYNRTSTQQASRVQPSFQGLTPPLPKKSNFFKPFTNAYDSLTEFIAKKFVGPAMDSVIVKKYAEKTKNNKGMINHINAINSFVISGLYMYKTLTNKDMDVDRKKTLAINQGLTLGISTGGAYLIDGSLNGWWKGVTEKYTALQLNNPNFSKEFAAARKATKGLDLQDYVQDVLKNADLAKKIKAMDIAKKLFIFAMIYRFVTPVLVTPIANKIGDHLLEKKKAAALKAAEQQKA